MTSSAGDKISGSGFAEDSEQGRFSSSPAAPARTEQPDSNSVSTRELREMQSRLIASETLVHSILQTAPVGIGVMNAQRIFLAANPAMTEITGYPTDELIGHSSRQLYPSEEEFTRIGTEKDRQLLTQGHCSIEARLRHKNGQPVDVIWSIAPLAPESPDGLFTVSFQDISQRKQAEAELALRGAALDAAANAILITDRNGTIEWANRAFFAMTGYSPPETLGFNPSQLVRSGQQDAQVYRELWQTIKAGKVWQGQLINRRRDGSTYHEFQTITPVCNEHGAISHYIAVKENITSRILAEQELTRHRDHLEELVDERTSALATARNNAEQMAQARSEFLANMSHEIRTPLNAVLGLAQIGLRAENGSAAHEHFERILEAGELLLGIVNDILDFSKIEAGKLTIEHRPVNLDSLIAHATNLSNEKARSKGIQFLVIKAPEVPIACLGDELRMLQILLNLLSNAIKFTSHGSVTLNIYCQDGQLVFRITDTGIGMSGDQIRHLFRPFEQAESSTTRRFGGTGLGLVISKRLLDLMGGAIEISSTEGSGSVFSVHLPLIEASLPPQLQPHSVSNGPRLGGLRILAAEDNEINRIVLEEILLDEGVYLQCVENGQQAVDRVSASGSGAWDIVLMDIMMPVMDGHEATRRLHLLDPLLPVIGLTAHAMDEERDKCLASGMLAHIAKPIDLDLLVETIARHARRESTLAKQENSPKE